MTVQLTFQELHHLHGFDHVSLATQAHVKPEVIVALLHNQPITRRNAQDVLATVSRHTGRYYTLSNVSILLLDEDKTPLQEHTHERAIE